MPDGLRLTRAVSVAAPPAVVWRWLCQLAEAPYSYDLVDNLGRRSPQRLTPGADDLEVGQRMAGVFRLTSWQVDHAWTGLVGSVSVTYAAEPAPDGGSRLLMRMVVDWPAPLAHALAWGDLVMARRQLLNLKRLAERSVARDLGPGRD